MVGKRLFSGVLAPKNPKCESHLGAACWLATEKPEMCAAEGLCPMELKVGGRRKNQFQKMEASNAAVLRFPF